MGNQAAGLLDKYLPCSSAKNLSGLNLFGSLNAWGQSLYMIDEQLHMILMGILYYLDD